jgi:D-specific alpha-keto acid dehydrogenase
MGIAVYGCGRQEAALFREMAPRFGVLPSISDAAVSEATIGLASGTPCISVGHKAKLAPSILAALSQAGVRYISTRSVGYDHIDVHCAENLGIAVENVAYSPDSVADFTLMLMLMLVRHAKSTLSRVQTHDYRLNDVGGRELRDMTIGVVGMGNIGASVRDRLRGFGCRVLAYDRCPTTSAEYVPLDELVQRSDIVTLHVPLNVDTHHLLSRQRLEQMKDGAFIINTGRGALVDTTALLDALEGGRLGGAALDVLEGEEGIFYSDRRQRPVESQLLLRLHQLPNVIITPHTAYYTDHALSDIVENTLANCRRFAKRTSWID